MTVPKGRPQNIPHGPVSALLLQRSPLEVGEKKTIAHQDNLLAMCMHKHIKMIEMKDSCVKNNECKCLGELVSRRIYRNAHTVFFLS